MSKLLYQKNFYQAAILFVIKHMFKKISLLIFVFGFAVIFIFPHFSLAAGASFGWTRTYFGKIYSGDGKEAKDAYFDGPQDFAQDKAGNFYLADTRNNVIRKIEAKTKKVSTLAGNGDFGQIDGVWNKATFGFPEGIDVDKEGNVYVADTVLGKIRKYDKKTRLVSTLFSNLKQPKDVMIRGRELFIAEAGNNRILKGNLQGGALQVAVNNISLPRKLAWQGSMLFVASDGLKGVIGISLTSGKRITVFRGAREFGGIAVWRNRLYVVESDRGVWNWLWEVNLANLKVKQLHKILETELLNHPSQVLIKEKKVVRVVGKKIKKGKRIKTIKEKKKVFEPEIYILYSGGSSIYKFGKSGKKKTMVHFARKHRFAEELGKRKKAQVGQPKDIVIGRNQKMYFSANNQIFLYDFKTQKVSHLAGHPMDSYREGKDKKARFSDPTAIALSPDEKFLYIVDRNNNRIRKLNLKTKKTSYLTGAGEINSSNESQNGYQEGGPCKNERRKGVLGCAYFSRPTGLAVSRDGKTLYVADAGNNRIRKVDVRTGRTSLLAGSGVYGWRDGGLYEAQFRGPYSLALSPSGRYLNVADKYNNAIRGIDLKTGRVFTLVGRPPYDGYREGPFSLALLSIPEYIKFGPDGNLYFSEAGNLRLRMVDFSTWQTRLVAGSGRRGIQNGQREFVRFSNPKGFAFAFGKIYLADFANDLIREISR